MHQIYTKPVYIILGIHWNPPGIPRIHLEYPESTQNPWNPSGLSGIRELLPEYVGDCKTLLKTNIPEAEKRLTALFHA
jgi:hypothetical protein